MKNITIMTPVIVMHMLITSIHLSADEKLRMLVWEGYAPEEQVSKFEKYIYEKYNTRLTMEVKHISDPHDFYLDVRAKRADLISPTHNLINDSRFNFIKNNLILPVNLKNVPNYKSIITALQESEYFTWNDKVYAVPFIHGPYGLAYNTGHFASPPDSWSILWQPEFIEKYAVAEDYAEVNIYITALTLGYKKSQLSNNAITNNPEFKKKLALLAKNAKRMWKGVDSADDLQGLSLAAVWGFSFPELEKRGEIWKIADPKEGTMGWVDSYAIGYSLKDKPLLKKFAEEWLNFLLSPDFQVEAVVRGLGSDPVNLTIEDRLTAKEIEKHHIDNPDYFQNNRILWPTVQSKRDRNGMKFMWDRAKKSGK